MRLLFSLSSRRNLTALAPESRCPLKSCGQSSSPRYVTSLGFKADHAVHPHWTLFSFQNSVSQKLGFCKGPRHTELNPERKSHTLVIKLADHLLYSTLMHPSSALASPGCRLRYDPDSHWLLPIACRLVRTLEQDRRSVWELHSDLSSRPIPKVHDESRTTDK